VLHFSALPSPIFLSIFAIIGIIRGQNPDPGLTHKDTILWGAHAPRVSAAAPPQSRTFLFRKSLFRRVAKTCTRVAHAPQSAGIRHASSQG
jgi:hypothetical protein